jgi:hypothetical protein
MHPKDYGFHIGTDVIVLLYARYVVDHYQQRLSDAGMLIAKCSGMCFVSYYTLKLICYHIGCLVDYLLSF